MRLARLSVLALLALLPATGNAAEENENKDNKAAAERAGEGSIAAKSTGPLIEADQFSKQPKLVKQAKVAYPKEAVGKSGDVQVALAVDLDDKGSVVGAAVLEPKTPTGLGFEEAALTAAYDLGFEPAEIAGKPTAVQIIYTFKFPAPPPPKPEPPKIVEVEKPKPVPVENFNGQLLERGTRIPMTGILVTVYRSDGETPVGFENITDTKGAFHFFDLEPGTWKVRIEPSSYYPVRTSEEIVKGERTQVTYYVERGSYNPFDVVVEAKRERKEVSRTVIESAVIDKLPGAMGDPLAVVQNFAGVARAAAGSGEIIIRGSAPTDTLYFVDGTPIPNVYHFGGIRSVLPTGIIDSLEFYPGNFSPYYSNTTAGLIDVDTKKLKPKKAGGYVDFNLLDGGIFFETPLGDKAALAIAARRSWIDYIINAVLPSNAPINAVTLPRYYDYQLLATYRPAPAHELRLFVFGSDDAFRIILKNPGVAGTQVVGNNLQLSTAFYRVLATYKYVPNDHFTNTMRLSQGRDTNNDQFFNFILDYTTDLTTFRDTARYEWSKKLALMAGVDFFYKRDSGIFNIPAPPQEGQTFTSNNLADVLHEQISGQNSYDPGAFAELELKPLPQWLLLPGVRFDYFSKVSQFTTAPRFTTRYELTKQVTLKGGVGLFYQQPSIDQTDRVFGNPALKCEWAIHYSGGAEWRPRSYITLDATGFYKDLGSMVSVTPTLADGSSPATRLDNNGKGRVYGLEFVAKHELTKKFVGWIALTMMRSERLDSGATAWRLFEYDQPFILTILGSYQLPRNWQIGGRFRYTSGNPTTPVVGSVYNASADSYLPIYGAKYSTRVPAFAQLDIRLDKRWIYNKWIFNAYVDLQNVTNRSNPEQPEFNFNYQKSQYSTGFPIYPIIGLRGEL
jgi:TonB family protein